MKQDFKAHITVELHCLSYLVSPNVISGTGQGGFGIPRPNFRQGFTPDRVPFPHHLGSNFVLAMTAPSELPLLVVNLAIYVLVC